MNNFQIDVVPGASAPIVNSDEPNAATIQDDDRFFQPLWGGGSSETGVTVTPRTALAHGPVWQAVNLLAGDIGQLPLRKMRVDGRKRTKDRTHYLDILLTQKPNSMQTASVWKETMLAWALLWGNGISLIDRGGPLGARVISLLPLLPDRTSYTIVSGNIFITTWIDNKYYLFDYDECIHIRGLATNGFWGESAVTVAKNVVSHGIALRKHGNATFKSGATPAGALVHPGKLTPEARASLRNEWNAIHGGVDNAGKIAVLVEGLEFKPIAISNNDAQWLEAMKLDREQIASLFNLPAHKLNALENSAVRANLEEQNRNYLQTSLSRWMNRFIEECKTKLLTEKEKRSGNHYFRWFPEAFLRADTEKRFEAYSKAITSRWMSPNEVREKEDMNPYEGGDEYANPAIDQKENTQQVDAVKTMLASRVNDLIQHEANRVERGARANNFVDWLTKFYDGYEEIASKYLVDAMNCLRVNGVDINWREAIGEHAENGRQDLLCIADTATMDDLQAMVSSHSENLRDRAKTLYEKIMEKTNDGN